MSTLDGKQLELKRDRIDGVLRAAQADRSDGGSSSDLSRSLNSIMHDGQYRLVLTKGAKDTQQIALCDLNSPNDTPQSPAMLIDFKRTMVDGQNVWMPERILTTVEKENGTVDLIKSPRGHELSTQEAGIRFLSNTLAQVAAGKSLYAAMNEGIMSAFPTSHKANPAEEFETASKGGMPKIVTDKNNYYTHAGEKLGVKQSQPAAPAQKQSLAMA